MTASKITSAIAALALILSSSVAFAQRTAPSTGGDGTTATGQMNGESGMKGDIKPGMESGGMSKSDGMKSENGMADKKK